MTLCVHPSCRWLPSDALPCYRGTGVGQFDSSLVTPSQVDKVESVTLSVRGVGVF